MGEADDALLVGEAIEDDEPLVLTATAALASAVAAAAEIGDAVSPPFFQAIGYTTTSRADHT